MKRGQPYDKWHVSQLTEGLGFTLLKQFPVDKSRFPGYVHRTTLGTSTTMDRVKDGAGAVLYVCGWAEDVRGTSGSPLQSTAGDAGPSLASLDARLFIIVLPVEEAPQLTDADVESAVLKTLAVAPPLPDQERAPVPAGCYTALDIRAKLRPAVEVDTRVLNRVLYDLRGRGLVRSGSPVTNGRRSLKPTWALV